MHFYNGIFDFVQLPRIPPTAGCSQLEGIPYGSTAFGVLEVVFQEEAAAGPPQARHFRDL